MVTVYFSIYSKSDVKKPSTQKNRVNLQECEEYLSDFENYEQSQRYRCYADKIAYTTREFGVTSAINSLNYYFKTPEGKSIEGATCHVLAHVIGEVAVSSLKKGGDILKECGTFCTSGCLNGAAHVYILTTQDVKDAEKFCNSADVDNKTKLACYHGVGHGITEYLRFNIEKGLSMCDNLRDQEGRRECGHAVLMDYIPMLSIVPSPIPPDILRFCLGLNAVYKDSCYEYAGALEYARSKNTTEAFSVCSKMISGHSKDRCMTEIIGILLNTTPRSARPGLIADICNFPERQKTRTCFYSAVQMSIFTIGTTFGGASAIICEMAPSWLQKDCYLKIAGSLLQEYGEDSKNKFCKEVMPEQYKKECEGGSIY